MKDRIKRGLTAETGAGARFRERALLALYEKQTREEQDAEQTIDHNGVGFNGVDAELLTSFAKQLQGGRFMTPKQDEWLRQKMPKYASQLARLTETIHPKVMV